MRSPGDSTERYGARATRWTPFTTSDGVGWVGWSHPDSVGRTVLPGGAPPRGPVERNPPRSIERCARALADYFNGRGPLPDAGPLPGLVAGTSLRRMIYERVVAIPPGSTLTYAEVARECGAPGAARAVGAAMAENPVAPLIPCHRVVGSDGSLRGYAGGIEMKRRLLDMEASRA